ncbi:MAG: hypothetical protein IKD18_03665 [Clostridia bacterium]|nr:hypothetical protein [Clostridia bacterium]
MKKLIAFFLILATLLSLASCGTQPVETATLEETKTAGKNEEKKTEEKEEKEEVVYVTVENPLSEDDIAAIPVANSSMTTDQLRQICLDFLALQVSFPWTPKETYAYHVERQGYDVQYKEGQLYAGIPYVNVASGNVYRYLDVIDSETGILDPTQFNLDNNYFGTACSGSACWAIGRVVNSANYSWTATMNKKHGFIPVGSYTYDDEINRYGEDGFPNCSDITKSNGKAVMFEAYAQMLPADIIVNNGHVRLNASVPNVVRNEDGTINGAKSTSTWSDQGMYRNQNYQMRKQSDGTEYSIQGGVNVTITFDELYSGGYLPHTFKEFLGTDPVEDAQVSLDVDLGDTLSAAQITTSTLTANYAISDVYFNIYDSEGNFKIKNAFRAANHFTYKVEMAKAFPSGFVNIFGDGTYTLEICVQLSNGAKPVLAKGILTK